MLDEVKIFNYGLTQAEIAGMYTGIPMQAFKPSPADGAEDINPEEVVLSWSGDAITYDLYMGSSPDQLALVAEGLTAPTYTIPELSAATTYFWSVTAHGEGQFSVKGDTWSYSTAQVTGLKESESLSALNAYPNPFSDQITLTFELKKQDVISIAFYDMQNRRIAAIDYAAALQAGEHQINISIKEAGLYMLKEGIYLCVIQSSDNTFVRRVIYLKE